MVNLKSALYSLKYLFAFSIPLASYLSIELPGIGSWLCVFYAFGLVPIVEWLWPMSNKLRMRNTAHYIYNFYLICLSFSYFLLLYYFFDRLANTNLTWLEFLGKSFSMGISGGVVGINVAHELGHRKHPVLKLLAHVLLSTTNYLHFYLEHNFGHHKLAATVDDPASARRGESVYSFWLRCIPNSFISAWAISKKRSNSKIHLMWAYIILQLVINLIVYFYFGILALLGFLILSIIAILLLETVNYVEHYGLTRNKSDSGFYEMFSLHHAWNSDHLLGRLVLFELSQHSDHHLNTTKAYENLQPIENSPQLPTGYPGSMVLSLFPVLWRKITHPILDADKI